MLVLKISSGFSSSLGVGKSKGLIWWSDEREILKNDPLEAVCSSDVEDLFDLSEEEINAAQFIQSLTRSLSLASSNFVLSYVVGEKILWKEGWEEILQEPEFKERNHVTEFIRLIRSVEKSLDDLSLRRDGSKNGMPSIEIYIGRENPFVSARDFATIIAKCCFPA